MFRLVRYFSITSLIAFVIVAVFLSIFYRPDIDHWAVQVSDTGPGIPVEAHAYIFEAFRQVDGQMQQSHNGSGLGLSIVKQLTTLMGGNVQLDSAEGQGAIFTITLPLEPPHEENGA